MKLRTEMVEQSPMMCDFDALKHDAAAAHALLQAIQGLPKQYREWAEMRADELMCEWTKQDEVAK